MPHILITTISSIQITELNFPFGVRLEVNILPQREFTSLFPSPAATFDSLGNKEMLQ